MSDAAANLTSKERQILHSNETPILVARDVTSVRFGGLSLAGPLVILTSDRFIASRKKMFGAPASDIDVPWSDWSRIDSQTNNGNMMSIVLSATTNGGLVEIISGPTSAYDIETTARDLYLR